MLPIATAHAHPSGVARHKTVGLSGLGAKIALTMRFHSTGVLVAAAIAAYALYSPMQAFEHGQISAMPQTCQSRMNDIFDSYYNITVLDGTFNCTDIILTNLNNADGVNCTAPEDVRACFNYVYGPWQSFVRDCELFSAAPSCVQSGVTKCAKPVATDPWWLHLLGALWRTNTYNYGTGVVPNHGEGWQSYAAEGEGSRRLHRRLLQDSESEGGGSGSSAGCFPDFYTAQDFDDWLQGTYQAPVFGANYSINPVGIILWLVHAAGILSMAAF